MNPHLVHDLRHLLLHDVPIAVLVEEEKRLWRGLALRHTYIYTCFSAFPLFSRPRLLSLFHKMMGRLHKPSYE